MHDDANGNIRKLFFSLLFLIPVTVGGWVRLHLNQNNCGIIHTNIHPIRGRWGGNLLHSRQQYSKNCLFLYKMDDLVANLAFLEESVRNTWICIWKLSKQAFSSEPISLQTIDTAHCVLRDKRWRKTYCGATLEGLLAWLTNGVH